jgi:hypothetical protein
MQVIAHHRIGAYVDGEERREKAQTVPNPLLPMVEVLARVVVLAAQECATDAAGHAVVVRGVLERSTCSERAVAMEG